MLKLFLTNPTAERTFYIGLFLGLSMLFSITIPGNIFHLSTSQLSVYTNIYTLMGLTGGVISFYRFSKIPKKDGNIFVPELISFGLLAWALGQVLWAVGMIKQASEKPYGYFSDIFYLASLIFWIIVLTKLYKPLKLEFMSASNKLSGIYKYVLAAIIGLVGILNRNAISKSFEENKIFPVILDFLYLFLPLSAAFVAGTLYFTQIPNISVKVRKCITFLFYATLLNFIANAAFVVTKEFPPTDALTYSNGGWVDYLYFSSSTCWCIATTIFPASRSELTYSYVNFGQLNVFPEDVFKAANIAEQIFQTRSNHNYIPFDHKATLWIMNNLPESWKIIKCGDEVIGGAVVLPVSEEDMIAFKGCEISERELFNRIKKYKTVKHPYIYLTSAAIQQEHRHRGLAFQCSKSLLETYEFDSNMQPKIVCWPISEAGLKLSNKLKAYFTEKKHHFEIINSER